MLLYCFLTNFSLTAPDVDARRWYRRAADIPGADLHHQLKGWYPLQLREGANHRHILIHTETMQAHDHYYYHHQDCNFNYYFFPKPHMDKLVFSFFFLNKSRYMDSVDTATEGGYSLRQRLFAYGLTSGEARHEDWNGTGSDLDSTGSERTAGPDSGKRCLYFFCFRGFFCCCLFFLFLMLKTECLFTVSWNRHLTRALC